MKNSNYQTVPVYDYLKMLDKEIKYVDNDAQKLKVSVNKYLKNARRAQTNARILESLLS